MRPWIRILGIDPGFRITGFGVIDTNGQENRYVTSGVINARQIEAGSARLEKIFNEVRELVSKYEPKEMAVERVFLHRNADSALKLGQARAAAICASFSGNMPVYEYAAREVKQALVGKGGAAKEQVQHMVRILLALDGPLEMDASDALGIAVCHAHNRSLTRRYAGMLP